MFINQQYVLADPGDRRIEYPNSQHTPSPESAPNMSSANSGSATKAVASEKPIPSASVSGDTLDGGGASSSSYAKMLNPKASSAKQTDKETTTNEKESTIKKTNKPKTAAEESSAKLAVEIKEVKPQPEAVASAENAKQVDETGVEAEEDDPTFIPVIPQHIRKENKRRERPTVSAKSRGPSSAAQAASVKHPAPTNSDVKPARRAERKERRGGADKETKADKEGIKAEVSNEQVSLKPANDDEKEKEDAVKFVEAPIPVVNAWKVDNEVSNAT